MCIRDSVDVELPLETSKGLLAAKVLRKNFLGETRLVLDNKGTSVRSPTDDVLVVFVFSSFQDAKEDLGKGALLPTPASCIFLQENLLNAIKRYSAEVSVFWILAIVDRRRRGTSRKGLVTAVVVVVLLLDHLGS